MIKRKTYFKQYKIVSQTLITKPIKQSYSNLPLFPSIRCNRYDCKNVTVQQNICSLSLIKPLAVHTPVTLHAGGRFGGRCLFKVGPALASFLPHQMYAVRRGELILVSRPGNRPIEGLGYAPSCKMGA